MPRFAANLSMMFNEVPFLDRFDAAAKSGIHGPVRISCFPTIIRGGHRRAACAATG